MTENKIGPFYFSREEATYLIDGLLCVENNGYSFGSSDDDMAAHNLILKIAEKDNDLAVKYRYSHQELCNEELSQNAQKCFDGWKQLADMDDAALESEEAEKIRDELDVPWGDLTEEDRKQLDQKILDYKVKNEI